MARTRTFFRPLLALLLLAGLLMAGCGAGKPTVTIQQAAVKHRKPGSVNAIPLSQKGATNGVATLDGSKHLTQKQLLTGGTAGECLQRKSTEELQWGACGSGSGKSQVEIEAFSATRNLSNVNTAAEARTNLGLGTIATKAASEYATTTELALKAPLASPTFTGTPLTPTAAEVTNNTQVASTAFAHTVASAAQSAAETASLAKTANSVKATNIEAGAVESAKLHSEAVTLGSIKAATPVAGKALVVKAGGTELEWATVGGAALPEWLTGLESKSSSGGKIKLNLEKGRSFKLTITEATTIELEKVPAGLEADEVLIFWKENATGGFAVTLPSIKWVGGSAPTFSTAAEAESLATLIIPGEAGKATPTNIYGVTGQEGKEGKEGPKGTTGTTGPEGVAPNQITEETFAVSGTIGASEKFPGFFIRLATSEKQKLVGIEYQLQEVEAAGFAKFKLYKHPKGGSNEAISFTGAVTEVEATATQAKTAPASTYEPAAETYLFLETTAVKGTTPKPTGLTVTVFLEHIG